jgi:hypothetical protein
MGTLGWIAAGGLLMMEIALVGIWMLLLVKVASMNAEPLTASRPGPPRLPTRPTCFGRGWTASWMGGERIPELRGV